MSGKWMRWAMAAVAVSMVTGVPALGGAEDGQRASERRQPASRSVMMVTQDGVFEVPAGRGPQGSSASRLAAAFAAPPEAPFTTLWNYDDPDAIADGVAIDDLNVWGAWRLTGARLTAHAILGDGTPAFEFSSFGAGSSGVASAKGADRIVFVEGNSTNDQYKLHGFTSQSGGTPDWTFDFPPTMTNILAGSRRVAVSYDGSTAAAIGRDTAAETYTLYIFDAATGEVTFSWTDTSLMGGVDLTDDGSLALVTQQSLATLIDTVTGEIVFQTSGSGAGSIYYDISGDGNVFVVGGFDLDVYEFDGTTYQQVIHFTRETSWFGQSAAVSRDGSTVGALAQDHGANHLETEAYLFDVPSGELLGSQLFTGSGQFQGAAADAAANDDGSVVAFASWGTEPHDWPEVMVFNRDVELIGAIHFPGSAFSVDVSADGQHITGGSKAVHANDFGNGGRIEVIELAPGDNPIPVLSAIDPDSVIVGADGVTLTASGGGFREESVVRFDGVDRPTTFVDSHTLTAQIPAEDLDTVGTFPVTVFTPEPGGGESQPKMFEVVGVPPPDVEVDPDSFTLTLESGASTTEELTISNLGQETLEWEVTEESGLGASVQRGTGSSVGESAGRDALAAMGTGNASRRSPALRSPSRAAVDLASLLGSPLPGLRVGEPANGVVDCDAEPGIIIHDDGSVENGYSGNPNSVNEVRFVDLFTPSAYPATFSSVCVAFVTLGPSSLDFEIVVFDDDGPDGAPGTELGSLAVTADGLPGTPGEPVWFSYDISSLGIAIDAGGAYIGVRWAPSTPNVFIASDESPTNPPGFAGGYWWNDSDGVWAPIVSAFPNYVSLMVRAVEGAAEPVDCTLPTWVSIDPTSGSVPGGESQVAEVTFDATGLDAGLYEANLCLATNDPTTPRVVVPLALTVEGGGGGPIADISPNSFTFEVPQGDSDGDTLNVGNLGDADLTWSIAEAETGLQRPGAPYRYGLAGAPEFHAPVGYDRASGITRGRGEAPATPVVLPAPQPAAIGELAEGFDDITQLPGAGWALINNSEPLGPSSWFQGNPSIFPAHEGDPDAYIAANYESTDDAGDISNWLITPEVTIINGTQLTFWTRKSELFGEFADRMEVRMSVEGASTDVGDTAESVGDFTTLLLTINPELIPGEYPQEWMSFTVTVRERSREPVTGRFAFRYWVTDSGPEGTNGDYIGIDTVSVTQPGDGVGCVSPTDIPWLSTDPTSGTTPPAGTVPVGVTVDTADLEVGDHTAQLCVTTNDPAAPLVEVPVTLTVTGGGVPVADISPGSFEFELPVGGTDADVLAIGNIGTVDLVWSIDETEDGVGVSEPAAGFGRRAGTRGAATAPPEWMLHYDPRIHQDSSGHRIRGIRPASPAIRQGNGVTLGGGADWSSLGPPGGDVYDVAASPVDPNVVLAGVAPGGSFGGTLYRSGDGGATWTEVADLSGISVYDIEFTPAGDVYVGTIDGVWQSTDAGLTWVALDLGIGANDQVFDVAIDPSDPAILWAGVADALGGQPINVVRSIDGGATWTNRTPPLAAPMSGRSIAIDPNDSNTAIAAFGGGFGGGQVWVTTDAGATWTDRTAGLPANPFNAVVYDGTRVLLGGGLRFGSQPVGLYESTDLGVNWTALHDGTWPLLMVEDIAVDPAAPDTILVATDGAGVNRTTDGGATWEIGIGGTTTFAARSLRFVPGSSSELFLGTSSLAVFRSTDGGDTFVSSAAGISQIDLYSIAANPLDPNEIAIAFQGLNDGGVYSSLDGGTTWQLEAAPGTRYSTVRFAPDGTLYALSTGPTTVAEEGLYRRESDGSWTALGPDQGGVFESELQAMHFSVNDPNLIVLAGGDFGVAGFEATIWRSADAGQTWTKVFEGPVDSNADVTDVELVEDGTDQQMIASFTSLATQEGGVLRSTDGGLTWTESSTGLPSGFFRDPDLCAVTGQPQVFYLSGWLDFGTTSLFRSDDGGANWTPTGWTGQGLALDLACDAVDPQVLYAGVANIPVDGGFDAQVLSSIDGGVTFEPFTAGLEAIDAPRSLALAGTSRLLLASDKGAYATPLDGGGGGDCSNPTAVPWLSFAPEAGTTPPGESVPADVLVDAAGLEEGAHAARLCVTTNDPNAPLVEIPVLLTVTGNAR